MQTALRAEEILLRPSHETVMRPESHAIDYVGGTRALYGIWVVNLLLSIATLGFYRFWAKTRTRRFVWSCTRVDGEPFEYIGTGKELLLGFLKIVAVLAPLSIALQIGALLIDSEEADRVVTALQSLVVATLVLAGSYAARRYRMSRTLWRGIRFRQSGSPWRYAALMLTGVVLTIATLGLYLPFFQAGLARYDMANLHFGTAPFRFHGSGRMLLKPFLRLWLMVTVLIAAVWAFGHGLFLIDELYESGRATDVVEVGLALLVIPPTIQVVVEFFAYQAAFQRFRAANTSFEGLSFSMLELSGGQLFRLYAGNLLMAILSVGLLSPVVIGRSMRFWTRHLRMVGSTEFASIVQAERGAGAGEGLASFFDVDLG